MRSPELLPGQSKGQLSLQGQGAHGGHRASRALPSPTRVYPASLSVVKPELCDCSAWPCCQSTAEVLPGIEVRRSGQWSTCPGAVIPTAIAQARTRIEGMSSNAAPAKEELLVKHLPEHSAPALFQQRAPRLLNQAVAELAWACVVRFRGRGYRALRCTQSPGCYTDRRFWL